jgi:methylmalonyl-CoA/ethylmalonyl-CoA epimerase
LSVIRGVDHIGIAVRSIDETRGFYEAMGLEISAIEEVPHEGVRVAMIPCGDSRIELLEPLGDDSPISKFLERRGPGMHHLCLRTSDVHEADASLRGAGLRLLRDQPGPGAEGAIVQFVHPASSGGVLVEISEASVDAGGSATAEGG